MIKREKEKIPIYFGWFVIMAMIPQLLRFNGSTIDTLYKLVAIGILSALVVRRNNLWKVSRYFAFYLFGSVIGAIGTIVVNSNGVAGEMMPLIIEIILLYILYEGIKNESGISIDNIFSFYKIIVYFMFIAAVYNMIIHANSLIHMTSLSVYNSEEISSFFDNKNTYGVFLIFGSLAATILRINFKQTRWSIFTILFLINEMMAMCRTAIIISLVLISISFIINSDKKIRSIIVLFVLIAVLTIICNTNTEISNYITNNMFGSTRSLNSRTGFIENMLPLIRGEHFWVGYGNSNASKLAVQYAGNFYYHNTYLKNMISGGIVKLFLQMSLVITSINYGLKCRCYNRNIGNLCIISTAVYLIYAYVEAVVLLDTPVVSIMVTMFIISMPVFFYNALVYEKDVLRYEKI